MRIGIYVELLKGNNKSGIGRHIQGLIESLAQLDQENEYLLYFSTPAWGKTLKLNCPTSENFKLRPVRFNESWIAERPRVWWDIYLPLMLTLDGVDVFHGPNHFIPTRGRFKKVITIHDLAYFYMNVHGEGMDSVLERWTRKCLAAADGVIAVSNATAQDCRNEGVTPEKLTTIYQGYESKVAYSFAASEKSEARCNLNLPDNYILFIGTLQPRKNLSFLLDAYALSCKKLPQHLVLAGAKDECYQELVAQAERIGISDKVHFTGYVSDLERASLYENADLFVYPSKYEGFGLVLLEAMSYGIPVITTNVSSLPEVGGEAAFYVDLNDTEGFASALKGILTNEDARGRLINAGKCRAEHFKWEDTAKQHLNTYLSLARCSSY